MARRLRARFFDSEAEDHPDSSPVLSEAYRIPVADGVIRNFLAVTESHPRVAPFGNVLKLLDDAHKS